MHGQQEGSTIRQSQLNFYHFLLATRFSIREGSQLFEDIILWVLFK
jgi:hypothetical protein